MQMLESFIDHKKSHHYSRFLNHTIIRVQWLETLGPIEIVYRKLTIAFTHNGQQ